MDATRDEAINNHIMDLAITMSLIDRNLVRVTRTPLASVYGLPTGKALDHINARYQFMFTIHTDHAFAKGNRFLKPLDELVTRGVDLEAENSVDTVKRVLQAQPFYFTENEEYGVYLSDATLDAVMSDPKGMAILKRANNKRLAK